jgi:hypothetical protein
VSQPITLDDLMTTAEAATFLRLSPNTLIQKRWTGGGPKYLKLGDGKCAPVRYRKSDLTKWLAERQFTNTTQYTVDAKGQRILPPWASGSTPATSPASPPDKSA